MKLSPAQWRTLAFLNGAGVEPGNKRSFWVLEELGLVKYAPEDFNTDEYPFWITALGEKVLEERNKDG